MEGRVTEEGRRYRSEGTGRAEGRGTDRGSKSRARVGLTGQVALIDTVHFVSKGGQLAGPQCPDEALHPAIPPLQAAEELPDGVPVPPEVELGPQEVLEDTDRDPAQARWLWPFSHSRGDNCREGPHAATRGRQPSETGSGPRAVRV